MIKCCRFSPGVIPDYFIYVKGAPLQTTNCRRNENTASSNSITSMPTRSMTLLQNVFLIHFLKKLGWLAHFVDMEVFYIQLKSPLYLCIVKQLFIQYYNTSIQKEFRLSFNKLKYKRIVLECVCVMIVTTRFF